MRATSRTCGTLIIELSGMVSVDEHSAGAVVFRDGADGRRYLLLQNGGRWDFPKGNREEGEGELQTVLREVAEETGLTDVSVIPGFRKVIEYFYRRGGKDVHKQVIYLLASTNSENIKISFEHQGFAWFSFSDAIKRASYDNSKMTLKEADGFLRGKGPDGAADQY
ncbi:MAG: bis(5'-nucleosyl)-tetraphosphatase [Thaumarchaeota archaeon]|nr:bis(5'-nucleosyl)-tetraphosphatase [Nitrososphaerota archaeon]